MPITFYGSRFCPRCRLARNRLQKLQQKFPELQITYIEATGNLPLLWHKKIFMIPAIESSHQHISGFTLTKDQIADLLHQESLQNR